jgi:predicted nucleic acid-binding protein
LKIFLDTSLLSDAGLSELGEEFAEQVGAGGSFYVSAVTHFQLMWGYSLAGMSPARYQAFLEATRTEVAPLTRLDAERAAAMRPGKTDLLDALIAAAVKRYEATIWTRDSDFLKFLPKASVRLIPPGPKPDETGRGAHPPR